ncbi:accessory regulator AgrB [Butyrivibrio sp. X503]|uniref:accessory gene regulator B family protein n=1 Tax=Butyrivibrio sp. X503 TaxID=2364878 RepID=UPI000EA9AC04|nr:accessory gene regulator B family protein [Butyrivibrio sp. X503]RKM53913.1 accessory regulator AgrB [Butyrivibrio sp. X503]
MEYLSKKLTDYILEKNVIDKENYEIYKYGFESFLETAFCFASVLVIAAFMHAIPQALFFSFFFLMMRSYTGGLHLKTFKACYVSSCLILVACILLVKNLTVNPYLSIAIYGASVLAIVLLGPVDHPNKQVDEEDNKRFMFRSYIILAISAVTAVILFIIKNHSYLFLEGITFAFTAVTGFLGKHLNKYTVA